jgi:hypothetical protein
MDIQDRIKLLQISTRLNEWVRSVELDSNQKREFLLIMFDFGKQLSWLPDTLKQLVK